jgi:hypothetical protein
LRGGAARWSAEGAVAVELNVVLVLSFWLLLVMLLVVAMIRMRWQ